MSRTGGLISERGFSITSAALGGLTRFTCRHLRPSLARVQKHMSRHHSGAADWTSTSPLSVGNPLAVGVVQVLAETRGKGAQVADRLAGVVVPAAVVAAAADDAENGRVDQVDRGTPCSRG